MDAQGRKQGPWVTVTKGGVLDTRAVWADGEVQTAAFFAAGRSTPYRTIEFQADGRQVRRELSLEGHKRAEGAWVNGREDGLHATWWEDGEQATAREFRDGILIGRDMAWDPEGRLAHDHPRDEEGREHGFWRTFAAGVATEEGTYEHGARVGPWTRWRDGKVLETATFDGEGKGAWVRTVAPGTRFHRSLLGFGFTIPDHVTVDVIDGVEGLRSPLWDLPGFRSNIVMDRSPEGDVPLATAARLCADLMAAQPGLLCSRVQIGGRSALALEQAGRAPGTVATSYGTTSPRLTWTISSSPEQQPILRQALDDLLRTVEPVSD